MKKISFNTFKDFRHKKLIELEDKKISQIEFANSTFGFIIKNHIKAMIKPKNKQQVLQNYLYWLTFAERKITMETHLIKLGLGTVEELKQSVNIYVKRRDKTIIKLFNEFKEKPKDVVQVSNNLFEIILSDGTVLFASLDTIKELNFLTTGMRSPSAPIYTDSFITPYLIL